MERAVAKDDARLALRFEKGEEEGQAEGEGHL